MATFTNDCFRNAADAAGGNLTDDEVMAAFDDVLAEKERLQKAGQTDRMRQRLAEFAAKRAEQTKIAAAMQRRHAALNAIVRDRLDSTIDAFVRSGMTPRRAILAVMEGTQQGVEGGRNSVAAIQQAYEARYMGGLMRDLQRDVAGWDRMLSDPAFDADVLREMSEIREGGTRGITGNKDAQKVADIFARYAEMSRTDLNRLGASIGKLDGWSGAQTHDDVKMIKAGKQAWIDYVLPRLDLDRTFEGATSGEVPNILSDIYDTITTGVPNKPTPREKGQRVNPANLAKSLGKSRVLHFKNPNAALEYRAEFGFGNTASGILSHLRRASQMAGQMEVFGPNPEVMFNSVVESQARKVRDSNRTPAEKEKLLRGLRADGVSLRSAFDVMSGIAVRPGNVTAAKIGNDIRAVQNMAKLGGAVITSIPSDLVTNAIASQFRGSGFFTGLVRQLDGIMKGRGTSEQKEIAFLLGEGFDGLIGHIVHPAAAIDGPIGVTSRMQEFFFKVNGLNWWTDTNRAAGARIVAAEMGMRADTAYDALPDAYRHVLGLHGIDAARWDAIRKAGTEEIGGKRYITPDLIRGLDDDAVEGLVADRLAEARRASKVDEAKTGATRDKRMADFEERKARILDDARRDLELRTLAFVADEVSYGTIETDAASRRLAGASGATRPGTVAGEAMRYVMQFKGFPIAFTQRVLGRAIKGNAANARWIGSKGRNLGTIIFGLGFAGYMAMTMKDFLRGYYPPRDPSDPKTWVAALQQGGAMGIYGDFLFGEVNRFGGGFLETIAGPAPGAAAGFVDMLLKTREGIIDPEKDLKARDYLGFALQNTPFLNLFYTRPALDYLIINAAREWASPGYLKRQAKARIKDYGQQAGGPIGFARETMFRF